MLDQRHPNQDGTTWPELITHTLPALSINENLFCCLRVTSQNHPNGERKQKNQRPIAKLTNCKNE